MFNLDRFKSVFYFGVFMRKIGLRNIKTAIAVLITLLISFILQLISPDFSYTWYSPFFASIATVYSMQSSTSKSITLAKIRSFGSITGGLFGMVLILLYEEFLMSYITVNYGTLINTLVLYSITAIFISVLIYFLVKFKVNDLVFVAALTYLSVTISLRNNLPVIPFAINRIMSTIIGVLVALLINNFKIFRFKNKNILFVSGLDGCLLTKEKKLTSFSSYQLTNMLNDGLNFTISTTRTPASLRKILKGIPIRNNLMIMNGAVLYDIRNEKYLDMKYIEKKAQFGIEEYFKSIDRNIFTYTIIDEALSIYHVNFENEAEEKFYFDRKNDYFRNHIKGRLNETDNVIFYTLIDKLEVVNKYKEDLEKLYGDYIHLQVYEYSFLKGFYFLKIYTSKTSKSIALDEFLMNNKESFIISFGSKEFDLEIMQKSDFSFALRSADDCVKKEASMVIDSVNPDDLVRIMNRVFYSRDFNKELVKIKEKY